MQTEARKVLDAFRFEEIQRDALMAFTYLQNKPKHRRFEKYKQRVRATELLQTEEIKKALASDVSVDYARRAYEDKEFREGFAERFDEGGYMQNLTIEEWLRIIGTLIKDYGYQVVKDEQERDAWVRDLRNSYQDQHLTPESLAEYGIALEEFSAALWSDQPQQKRTLRNFYEYLAQTGEQAYSEELQSKV